MFEPKSRDLNMSTMAALKPIYLAFPNSSPFVLHSAISSSGPGGGGGSSSTLNTVLFSLATTLYTPGRAITIKTTTDIPTRALAGISIIKGTSSRGASSLGAWSIYADGIVDKSPLNPFVGSRSSKAKPKRIRLDDRDDERTLTNKRCRIANILFTGQDSNSQDYKSKASLPMAEIKVNEPYNKPIAMQNDPTDGGDDFHPKITIRLEGDDVFAGVFKLAVNGTIDVTKMPSWLTGEDGTTTITVKGGRSVPTI